MEDIATIGFGAETSGLDKAKTKLDGLVPASDKAQKASEKLTAATHNMSSATEKVSGKMSASAYQARMMAQQLSQVAQQTMAGGDFIRALGIQLPDMATDFGAVGIAAGVAAGIILPMLASAFGAVKDFDTALTDANETLKDTKALADLVKGGVSAMIDEFGRFGDDIQGLVNAQRQLSLRQLSEDANALAISMANLYNGNAWLNISRAEQLAQALGLSTEATNLLDRGLTALSEADTLDRQLQVATALRESFVMMVGPVSQMTSAQKDFYFGLIDTEETMNKLQKRVRELTPEFAMVKGVVNDVNDAMTALLSNVPREGWLSGAIGDAARLATTLWDAAHAAAVTDSGISVKANASTKGQGVVKDPRLVDTGQNTGASGSINLGMNSGKGGGGAAAKTVTDLQKIAAEYKKLTEPADQAKSAVSAVQAALDAGVIGTDQYTSAIARLEAAFIAAGGSAEQWAKITTKQTDTIAKQLADLQKSGFESLGGAIADLASGGTVNFGEMARSIIRDMINIAIQAAIIKPLMAAFGFDKGGAFNAANLNITPNAKGNAFSNSIVNKPTMFAFAKGGALGLMGEAGPEAVMPLTRGPDGSLGVQMYQAGQGSANSGPTVQVNVINNAPNTTTREESQKQSDGSEIRNIIIDTTRDGMANGEFDAVQSARYGNAQRKVVR